MKHGKSLSTPRGTTVPVLVGIQSLTSWIWSYGSGDDVVSERDSYPHSSSDKATAAAAAATTTTSTTGTGSCCIPPTETTGLLTNSYSIFGRKSFQQAYSLSDSTVPFDFVETTRTVQGKLQELEAELNRFPVQALSTYRYVQQQQQQQHYLEQLQILILRSEGWRPPQAATRLLRFLDAKLQWFGRRALSKPLLVAMTPILATTVNDPCRSRPDHNHNHSTIVDHYIQSGVFQILHPSRDNSIKTPSQSLSILLFFPLALETIKGTLDLCTLVRTVTEHSHNVCFLPAVHFIYNTFSPFFISQIKAWWRFIAMAVEDGRQQGTEFVAVLYQVRPPCTLPPNATWTNESLEQLYWYGVCSLQQLPIAIREWHCCSDEALPHSLHSPTTWFQQGTGGAEGLRHVQFHQGKVHASTRRSDACGMVMPPSRPDRALVVYTVGSQTECLYKLLQCGIPAGDLPLKHDGNIDLTKHHEWLRNKASLSTTL